MKPVVWLLPSCSLMLFLSSCTNNKTAGDPNSPGTGPFDAAGNYRDDWADDPTKWRRPGSRGSAPDDIPTVAKNEQPPANANPLAPKVESSPRPSSKPVKNTQPTVVAQTQPRETNHPTTVAKNETSRPKPKSTPVKVKPKVKPKPKTTRYTVKNGDSLSRIAARNGTSVSALQKANGISGTLIRPGQSLVIPKR